MNVECMTNTRLCENLGGAGVVLKGRRMGSGKMEGREKRRVWAIGERRKGRVERGKGKVLGIGARGKWKEKEKGENPGPILLCGAHTVVLCCDGEMHDKTTIRIPRLKKQSAPHACN